MHNAGASRCAPGHVWLSLVAILIGVWTMTSAEVADTPPPASMPPVSTFSVAQRASEQPGRPGVTEQPGRPGVTEQPSRSGAEPARAPLRDGQVPLAPSRGRLRPLIVEALLNQHVTVPLMLDTGATHTTLTKQTASDLGITGLERLPRKLFLTASGKVLSPVTTLQSIRVGTAEVQEVEVAIDVAGHLPVGLLGMTFLRHFKVTVDQEQAQVKFERR